jgi:hypothetical protein
MRLSLLDVLVTLRTYRKQSKYRNDFSRACARTHALQSVDPDSGDMSVHPE